MPIYELPDGRQIDAPSDEALKAFIAKEQPQAPTQDVGFFQGAGEAMKHWGGNIARGVEHPIQAAMGDEERLAGLAAEQRAADAHMSQVEQAAPGGAFVGSVIPSLIGITPGIGAGLAALEYGTPTERAGRAALTFAGGKAGEKLLKFAGRALSPRTALPQPTQEGLDAAQRIGVQLTRGQVGGSTPLRYLESAVSHFPGGGAVMDSVEQANRVAINRAAAKSIGVDADELSGAVLSQARSKLSSTFDFLTANKPVKLDKTFTDAAENALQISGPVTRYEGAGNVVSKVADDVAEVRNALAQLSSTKNPALKLGADQYQKFRSYFDGKAGEAYRAGNNEQGKAFSGVVSALDDAMERSLGGDTRKAFQQARRQWADLMILESGQVVEAGNVSAKRAGNALNREYGAAYKEGKLTGPLADIAKYGEAFRPLPQSGTANRNLWNQVALSGGTAALSLDPTLLASTVVAPWAIAKGTTSKALQDYTAKGGFARLSLEDIRRLGLLGSMTGLGATGGLLSLRD